MFGKTTRRGSLRSTHERHDGTGYPDRLAGDQIPVESRIISVCDAYSAMTTNRAYRRAPPQADALAELRRCAGTQFAPRMVQAISTVLAPESALTSRT